MAHSYKKNTVILMASLAMTAEATFEDLKNHRYAHGGVSSSGADEADEAAAEQERKRIEAEKAAAATAELMKKA